MTDLSSLSMQKRIYFSVFVNTLGSWLTFLAIALVVNGRFGPSQVALVFLVQTLPPILFSRSLANLIPIHHQERVFWVSQLLLAAISLVLVFTQELSVIYAHLFIGAFIKSISAPLFNTLIGKWVEQKDQKETFTRVGALQAGTLAIAPALGAWIKITYSFQTLFIIDAVTFILSIVVLKELFFSKEVSSEEARAVRVQWKSIFAGISLKPNNVPTEVQHHLKFWFVFLIVGALLNALEFAGFANIGMTETQIGYAMTAWGLGSFIAFVKVPNLAPRALVLGFAISLALFVFSFHAYSAIAAFFFAGLFSCYLSGVLRSALQKSVPVGYDPMPVWAYANQITQVINLVCYASAGLLLKGVGFYPFGSVTVLAAVFLMATPSGKDPELG